MRKPSPISSNITLVQYQSSLFLLITKNLSRLLRALLKQMCSRNLTGLSLNYWKGMGDSLQTLRKHSLLTSHCRHTMYLPTGRSQQSSVTSEKTSSSLHCTSWQSVSSFSSTLARQMRSLPCSCFSLWRVRQKERWALLMSKRQNWYCEEERQEQKQELNYGRTWATSITQKLRMNYTSYSSMHSPLAVKWMLQFSDQLQKPGMLTSRIILYLCSFFTSSQQLSKAQVWFMAIPSQVYLFLDPHTSGKRCCLASTSFSHTVSCDFWSKLRGMMEQMQGARVKVVSTSWAYPAEMQSYPPLILAQTFSSRSTQCDPLSAFEKAVLIWLSSKTGRQSSITTCLGLPCTHTLSRQMPHSLQPLSPQRISRIFLGSLLMAASVARKQESFSLRATMSLTGLSSNRLSSPPLAKSFSLFQVIFLPFLLTITCFPTSNSPSLNSLFPSLHSVRKESNWEFSQIWQCVCSLRMAELTSLTLITDLGLLLPRQTNNSSLSTACSSQHHPNITILLSAINITPSPNSLSSHPIHNALSGILPPQMERFHGSQYNLLRKNMSYYYPYYSSYLAAAEVEGALRRSRVEAELAASRAASEVALRRSRVEAEVAAESALRRSRVEAEIAVERISAENALRRSRLAAELGASRLAAESALRRSRLAAELEVDRRVAVESALRRSRVEADIAVSRVAAQSALRRSRVEADLAVQSALRRSRIEAEIESSRIRRLYYPYV